MRIPGIQVLISKSMLATIFITLSRVRLHRFNTSTSAVDML